MLSSQLEEREERRRNLTVLCDELQKKVVDLELVVNDLKDKVHTVVFLLSYVTCVEKFLT